MNEFEDLLALTRLLRGEEAEPADWPSLVNMANRTLVTAALAAAPHLQSAPQDIRAFVEAAGHLNRARNRRLVRQLADAAEALDRAGLECAALKGAAVLLSSPTGAAGRILSDLDILVDGKAIESAIAALEGAGFVVLSRYRNDDGHVAAELHREGDVGMIDLHRRPPGPRHILSSPGLATRIQRLSIGSAQIGVPTLEVQILHLAMHDLFHEGDYWSGGLDLRHLHDVAVLANGPGSVDWGLFSQDLLGGLGLRAVRRYLMGAADLFGAPVPTALLEDRAARLQHWRSIAQLRRRAARPWLVGMGLLAEAPLAAMHYARERRWRRSTAKAPSSVQTRLRGRLARLGRLFEPPLSCKV